MIIKELEASDDFNSGAADVKLIIKKIMEAVDDLNGDGSSEKSSSVPTQESGSRNKRKFLSEFPLDISVDSPAQSLTEFPRYEFLEEKLNNTISENVSLELHQTESSRHADWDDPIACELEKLLEHNLCATFKSAVKRIVESGYDKEVAELAVLRSGLCHGIKDPVSNVVDGALALLTKEKYSGTRYQLFEEFDSLVEYTILEMICVLREVKPYLTVAEAMWHLLICDLNLLHACAVKEDPSCELFSPVDESKSSSDAKASQSNKEASKDGLKSEKSNLSKSSQSSQSKAAPQLQKHSRYCEFSISGKDGSISLLEMEGGKALIKEGDEKSWAGRKGSSLHSKKDLLRQKTFHFEKTYKGRMGKGAFRAKFTSWSSMVLEKSLNSPAGSAKISYSKTNSKTKAEESNSASSKSGNNSGSASPLQDAVFALPALNSKNPASSDPRGKIPISSYYAGIPYDESLGKYVPQNEKDETILMLIPHMQKLEKEIQSWTDWATEKVRQATRRLGKDQAELRMLREEKEEAEQFQKDKKTLEESTAKRLGEMEHAISNASAQTEMANSSLHRLKAEHAVLKKRMEAAKVLSVESSRSLQEAMLREQEALKNCQAWEVEKGLLQEELSTLKSKGTNLQQKLEMAKKRQNQIQALCDQEEKEKKELLRQGDILRGEREQLLTLAKLEEDRIRKMTDKDMQKCKTDIDRLASEIAELRLESDASRIEALRRGIPKDGNSGPHNPVMTKRGVKPERECVMCMTEEISVVFLPCAHQVLCTQCNVLHEKQGMNDCPSCRTPIKKRISVRFRG